MKKLIEFLKTTLMGGLFVLLPVLLLYLLLSGGLFGAEPPGRSLVVFPGHNRIR